MAKKPKETVVPPQSAEITLEMIASASSVDPFFMFVPAEVSKDWLEAGLVEVNSALSDDTAAIATRITEKGRQSLMSTAPATTTNTETTSTPTTTTTQAPAAAGFIRAVRPAIEAKRATRPNAAKYPFDELAAPSTDADGNIVNDAFFIPATPARPEPWKSLASTVSTAKDRYSRKVGERPYKAKDKAGNEITKMRAVKEFDREFLMEAGEAEIDGKTVKGAWVHRVK